MHKVQCRTCKQYFDTDAIPREEWMLSSHGHYHHTKCYNDWKASQPKNDDEWIPRIYDFLTRDLKVNYNWYLCDSQRKKFLKEGKTNKGIYFALKYFYEVQKNPWDKGHGGIGIVGFVYQDSVQYWTEQERKQRGFMQAIEEQLNERQNREVVKIKRPQSKKEKIKYRLEDVGGEDDR